MAADFDGDGVPDLAVVNSGDNNVGVLLGKGDGTFQPQSNFGVGNGPTSAAVGDFNGDGIADLAVTSANDNTVARAIGATGTAPSRRKPRMQQAAARDR